MRFAIYTRTSGDEKETGQDCAAQERQVEERLLALGHEVATRHRDDGVSGESRPGDRDGWQDALQATRSGLADAIAIRDPARFSRQEPAEALQNWQAFQDGGVRVLCIESDTFTTLHGKRTDQEPRSARLVRYIAFWEAWSYRQATIEGTNRTMQDFKHGRRKPTAPVGRPVVEIDPSHLAAARILLKTEGKEAAWREVLARRGYYEVKDAEAQKRRYVSRNSVLRALGVLGAVQNPGPSKIGPALQDGRAVAKGPVVDDGGRAA